MEVCIEFENELIISVCFSVFIYITDVTIHIFLFTLPFRFKEGFFQHGIEIFYIHSIGFKRY